MLFSPVLLPQMHKIWNLTKSNVKICQVLLLLLLPMPKLTKSDVRICQIHLLLLPVLLLWLLLTNTQDELSKSETLRIGALKLSI